MAPLLAAGSTSVSVVLFRDSSGLTRPSSRSTKEWAWPDEAAWFYRPGGDAMCNLPGFPRNLPL